MDIAKKYLDPLALPKLWTFQTIFCKHIQLLQFRRKKIVQLYVHEFGPPPKKMSRTFFKQMTSLNYWVFVVVDFLFRLILVHFPHLLMYLLIQKVMANSYLSDPNSQLQRGPSTFVFYLTHMETIIWLGSIVSGNMIQISDLTNKTKANNLCMGYNNQNCPQNGKLDPFCVKICKKLNN